MKTLISAALVFIGVCAVMIYVNLDDPNKEYEEDDCK